MAKYILAVNPNQNKLVMMKATVASPGDSDWSVADCVFLGSRIVVASSVEDSSDIHVVVQKLNGHVIYNRFDPGTDAFTVRNELVSRSQQASAIPEETQIGAGLAVRGDGDVVVIASYFSGSSDSLRAYTRESGVWTDRGLASIGGASEETGVFVCPKPHSSTDMVVFGFTDLNGLGARMNSISSTNVIGVNQTIDSIADTANIIVGQGAYLSTDEFALPYIDASNRVTVVFGTIDSTPSAARTRLDRSDSTVYGNGRTTAPFSAFCLAVESDDTVHLVYSDAATQDMFRDPDADNASDQTDIEELDAVTVNRISCRVVNTDADIYVAYDDAGTLKFLDIDISGGGGPPAGLRTLSLTGVGI